MIAFSRHNSAVPGATWSTPQRAACGYASDGRGASASNANSFFGSTTSAPRSPPRPSGADARRRSNTPLVSRSSTFPLPPERSSNALSTPMIQPRLSYRSVSRGASRVAFHHRRRSQLGAPGATRAPDRPGSQHHGRSRGARRDAETARPARAAADQRWRDRQTEPGVPCPKSCVPERGVTTLVSIVVSVQGDRNGTRGVRSGAQHARGAVRLLSCPDSEVH